MSYSLIWDAFDALAQTFTGAGDVVLEGNVYQPVEGRPYISCRMAGYSRVAVGVGANAVINESGTYQVSIRRPADEGRSASAFADQVVNFFKRGLALTTTGGQTVTILISAAQPAITDGDWISVPVMVQWFASDP